jgi:hypothetical protein
MRIFFFFLFIALLSGCTAVEVAKEITKATKSIKASINKTENSEDYNIKILEVEVEKKQEKKIIIKQKKVFETNFLEKPLKEIQLDLNLRALFREDGNTQITRFDTNDCRLFLFTRIDDPIKKIKHFEIRDIEGNLIIEKNKIQSCYKNFKLY